MEIIILRLVHVLGGLIWVGAGVFNVLFVGPALARSGPAAGSVMAEMRRRGMFVFLPIVVDDPEEQNNDRRQWAVGYAPFYITGNKSGNEHYGKLLADYLVYGKGQDGSFGWHQDYEGPITIRLTK